MNRNNEESFSKNKEIDDEFAHKYLKKEETKEVKNMRYFIQFNTKNDSNYRLKHYLYFGEGAKQNFEINFYNKFYRNLFYPPDLKYYPRYYNQKYDFEMESFNQKNEKKNRFYSLFYENWEDADHDKEIITTKEYKGFYSKQPDYQFFKIQLSQEI